MTTDARLAHLEAELERLRPSLLERVDRIEQALKAAAAAPKSRAARFVAWMGAELPKFLTASILLVVGFGIKDSVDLSIKQRQLDLSYAKEMQGLLQKMSEEPLKKTVIDSSAIVLASYGEAALPSLMNELRYTGLRADGAAEGIGILAQTYSKAVCEALPRVLEDRSRRYDWLAQSVVVRILGEAGCSSARRALERYREAVAAAARGDTAAFEQIASELPAPPADKGGESEDYKDLLSGIDLSLRLIGR